MHICIPDTREMRPPQGSAYLLYNVHIDGLYHCSLRFKQLLHLHQALTKKFLNPQHQMPQFPPKKLLPLSANQVEDRRQQLEKYLQSISQDKTISNSSIFNLFLLEAQRESTRIEDKHVHLDIELVNGQKIRLPLVTHDSADSVLTSVCRALGLNDRYHAYFCLCLCGYDVVRDKLIIKRKLSFFEAPFITLQMALQQQEQLQSVLSVTGPSSASTSTYCSSSSCLPHGVTVASRQSMDNDIVNVNNNSDLRCSCLNCSQKEVQQATAINTASSASTTGVPYVDFSTDITNSTNLVNQQQQQRMPCNGAESIYYRTSDRNGGHHAQPTSTTITTSTSSHLDPWSTTNKRSFVTHRILLRKSYWDPIYDSYILNDRRALDLLFIQTVYDMKHSLMFVDRGTYQQLETYLANDSKLEYILLARTLKYYNYVHFEPCYSDYPRPRTKVMISIGSKELNMRVLKTPRPLTPSNPMQQQSSLSPLSSASSSSASSSLTAETSTSPQVSTIVSPDQQEAHGQQPVLYCTSSLVPSGYRDLITKDDLIEEEHNFKVPLIRCWRLTSLETLNSAGYNQHQQQQNRQVTTTIAGGKRKSFSLFNSVVGNLNGSSDQCRVTKSAGAGSAQDRDHISHLMSSSTSPNSSPHLVGADESRTAQLISSGSSGHSLVSTLISRSERNSNHNSHGFTPTSDAHSFSRFNGNNNDSHLDCCQQFCLRKNGHQRPDTAYHRAGDEIDQTQLSQYELSFEYLVSRDRLQWITISSDQAIFISISLQGVVDELVSKRDCIGANNDFSCNPTSAPSLSSQNVTTSAIMRSGSTVSANTPTPPISIMASRNGSLSSQRQKLSESFTYLYRDGAQKLLKTQSIDRFCATLGGSPSHLSLYSTSRRANGSLATTGAINNLTQSAPANSRHPSLTQPALWNIDSRVLATSPNRCFLGYGQPSSNHQSTFEIANVKKAASPIINDAFEGVANDDEM